jgi:ABC-type antimicrobial peptide transport system permease subunit
MTLLGSFAIVALALSAVGLYGVIEYAVSQRTREIGVRVALGADSSAIAKLVVGNCLRLALVGVMLGIIGAFATSRALDSMIYGVTAFDPVSFAAIPLLLGAIALIASYVPTRRALRIDPVEALRTE